MRRLLEGERNGTVEARLFLARYRKQLGAGVFVIRCGRSMHYFWGATNRALSRERVGEAAQWAAIEWGLTQGCEVYDLEGIDPPRNPGVYAFKRKMGGNEITLSGKEYYPLGARGLVAAWIDGYLR
jgi:lipid II:glycine glycyltransferase (peptidoglycan interpeptide bridge formation enzyme)